MDLSGLKGMYEGARIGILGSGPTLNDFKDELYSLCDILIACNGSIMALDPQKNPLDYFLYVDSESPARTWFRESRHFHRPNGGQVNRILPNSLLPYDDIVLNSEIERCKLQLELLEFMKENPSDDKAYRNFKPSSDIILTNGFNFNYEVANISEMDIESSIYGGGTVTGTGSQIAWRMGASQINLFGCGFNNSPGAGVYAYDNRGEPGATTDDHKLCMDEILLQIQSKGVKVISFGETSLTSPEVITY